MTAKSAILYLYAESAIHAGTGSSVSVVDLPIQRERTTQFPNIQGSGVKGALRSQSAATDYDSVNSVFGRDPESNVNGGQDFAGALAVGEARILLFPVRSLKGVFAYTTCEAVLARFLRDVNYAGIPAPLLPSTVSTSSGSFVTSNSVLADKNTVILEEFAFGVTPSKELDAIAAFIADHALPDSTVYQHWQEKIKRNLILLSNDDFRDFVVNSTEITTHVRLNRETKTVAQGALWTQEMLPSDTLLYSNIIARDARMPQTKMNAEAVLNWLTDTTNLPERLQIGGDETTGQGLVSIRWQHA